MAVGQILIQKHVCLTSFYEGSDRSQQNFDSKVLFINSFYEGDNRIHTFPTKILQISLIVAYSFAKEICSKVPEIRDLHKKQAILKGFFTFS